MQTKDTHRAADCHRVRSPINAAAVLLGIYIGMYLAVAGMVHVLTSPDALAATAPDSSTASRADATAVTHIAGAIESPPSDSLGQASERTDNSRECKPSVAIDFTCVFGD